MYAGKHPPPSVKMQSLVPCQAEEGGAVILLAHKPPLESLFHKSIQLTTKGGECLRTGEKYRLPGLRSDSLGRQHVLGPENLHLSPLSSQPNPSRGCHVEVVMETRSFSAHGFRYRMGVFFIFRSSCLVKCFLCPFGKVHIKQIVFLASWCWQVANVECNLGKPHCSKYLC